jgi:chromosome segregation protein
MYLKSIEVQGFKSFANKIKFEFHNGITAIVGPNGSGKSNVADAVRWVLGEQSAKQLRGGNMQDVIFSGTELRKPLGYASVAITLDNGDHKLDTSYEEVTVTRRLYRSGESEYQMNGAACRLRDIHELFYDTGIGQEGYSIIGQGQIDKILSNKPEDRRELFDEAAGIVKFKRRKATTLKKLEEEEQNLTRVSDILAELTRQLAPLENQSKSARIYLKKKDELKSLDVNVFLLEKERNEKELASVREKYKAAGEELSDANLQLEKTKQEYDRLEQQLKELEQQLEEARQEASERALARKQMEGQIELLQEQIHMARQNRQLHEKRRQTIDEELDSRRGQEGGLGDELSVARKELSAAEEECRRSRQELEGLQEDIARSSEAVNRAKNEQIDLLNKKASAKGKMQRYDAMLEQINIRRTMLNQRLLVLKKDEERQQDILIDYRDAHRAMKKEIDGGEAKRQQIARQIEELQEQIEDGQKDVDARQAAYHRESSRLESLRNLIERYDGYGNSIRRVMEQKKQVGGLIGVVADLIRTDKKYETAIETALGGTIQNIVTENESTAKQMIEFLKKNRYGRATFLPLSSVRSKGDYGRPEVLKEPGVIQTADGLVHTQERFRTLMRSLLGRTLVVDTIDHGIALERKYQYSLRIVTLEGELLNPGGSMTGGAFKNSSNLLGRRRELDELGRQVKEIRTDLEEKQARLDHNRSLRNGLRDESATVAEQMKARQLELNTAEVNIQQAEEKIREIQSGYSQLKGESAEIEGQIREINEFRDSIRQEMKGLKASEKDSQAEAASQEELLETMHDREAELAKGLEAMHLKLSELTQQMNFRQENLARIRQEIRQFEEERESIFAGQKEQDEEEKTRLGQIAQVEAEAARGAAREKELAEQLQVFQKEKETLQESHRGFFARREEFSDHRNRLDKECFRLNSQIEKLEENQETQVSYLWDEYELTPVQAQELRMDGLPERAELKKRLNEVRDEIRRLGPVNVNAIEEYREVSERHAFLSGQHEDLVKAQDTLKNIIRELDEGMRRQFNEKFAEIQKEFDKAFKELFGGGHGALELVEDEDVLEAGVRITSQPPGKKLQNMMQLSGGEKALTAIALMFAIQNMKPSPFCLLDEIEAALDDSNVDRYANYLHKLTKYTQFIIITHRRGTMNAADRLYGITMQEKGVSTLVSVDLIEKDLEQ